LTFSLTILALFSWLGCRPAGDLDRTGIRVALESLNLVDFVSNRQPHLLGFGVGGLGRAVLGLPGDEIVRVGFARNVAVKLVDQIVLTGSIVIFDKRSQRCLSVRRSANVASQVGLGEFKSVLLFQTNDLRPVLGIDRSGEFCVGTICVDKSRDNWIAVSESVALAAIPSDAFVVGEADKFHFNPHVSIVAVKSRTGGSSRGAPTASRPRSRIPGAGCLASISVSTCGPTPG